MKNTVEIERIKKNLLKLPPEKIPELSNFIDFLLMKTSQAKRKNIKKLEGIWEGIGFENINIEKEIFKLRSEIDTSILGN